MKKYFIIVLLTSMILGMEACGNMDNCEVNTGAGETEEFEEEMEKNEKKQKFQAMVLEVNENSIMVEPLDGKQEQNSVDQVVVGFYDLKEIPSLSAGDTIQIEYNGNIAESDPPQLEKVYAIKLVEPLNQPDDKDVNKVVYSYEDIYMSMDLPTEWEYEIQTVEEMMIEDELVLCAIDFWPKENPDFRLRLGYWSDGIGMCGTGVTIEKITFVNGMSAWKYTESYQDELWLTIIYEQEQDKGSFVVQGNVSWDIWSEYEEEVMKLLDTVQFSEPEKM